VWPVVTDVSWFVCVSVWLFVGHNHELCYNGGTDQDAVWDMDSGGIPPPGGGRNSFWREVPPVIWPFVKLFGLLVVRWCHYL